MDQQSPYRPPADMQSPMSADHHRQPVPNVFDQGSMDLPASNNLPVHIQAALARASEQVQGRNHEDSQSRSMPPVTAVAEPPSSHSQLRGPQSPHQPSTSSQSSTAPLPHYQSSSTPAHSNQTGHQPGPRSFAQSSTGHHQGLAHQPHHPHPSQYPSRNPFQFSRNGNPVTHPIQTQSAMAERTARPPPRNRQLFDPQNQNRNYGNHHHQNSRPQPYLQVQSNYLNSLVPEVLRETQISKSELLEKERFRVALEKTAQGVIVDFAKPIVAIDPKSIQLSCYGSLKNGFATKSSDMDLLLVLPGEMAAKLTEVSLDMKRCLEKAFLDLGVGARLLTNTRVPIMRVCELPSPELLKALREERERSVKEDWAKRVKDNVEELRMEREADEEKEPKAQKVKSELEKATAHLNLNERLEIADDTKQTSIQETEKPYEAAAGADPKSKGRNKWKKLNLNDSVSQQVAGKGNSLRDSVSLGKSIALVPNSPQVLIPSEQVLSQEHHSVAPVKEDLPYVPDASPSGLGVPAPHTSRPSLSQATVTSWSFDVGVGTEDVSTAPKAEVANDRSRNGRSTQSHGADKEKQRATEKTPATQNEPAPLKSTVQANRRNVPHLEFPTTGVGVQCDLNFTNFVAIHNTMLLRCYVLCDPRVQEMGLFVKAWTKRRKINSPYHGTLSSYGYILMVLHYLMNIANPPVIPNLQHLYKPPSPDQATREVTFVDGLDVRFYRDENKIQRYAQEGRLTQNRQSLGSLLREFFEYYGSQGYGRRQFNWMHEVLSLRTRGGILSKEEKGWTGAKNTGNVRLRYLLAIEDPFEIDHNIARTVVHGGIVAIRDEFRRAYKILNRVESIPDVGWVWVNDDGTKGDAFFAETEDRLNLQRTRFGDNRLKQNEHGKPGNPSQPNADSTSAEPTSKKYYGDTNLDTEASNDQVSKAQPSVPGNQEPSGPGKRRGHHTERMNSNKQKQPIKAPRKIDLSTSGDKGKVKGNLEEMEAERAVQEETAIRKALAAVEKKRLRDRKWKDSQNAKRAAAKKSRHADNGGHGTAIVICHHDVKADCTPNQDATTTGKSIYPTEADDSTTHKICRQTRRNNRRGSRQLAAQVPKLANAEDESHFKTPFAQDSPFARFQAMYSVLPPSPMSPDPSFFITPTHGRNPQSPSVTGNVYTSVSFKPVTLPPDNVKLREPTPTATGFSTEDNAAVKVDDLRKESIEMGEELLAELAFGQDSDVEQQESESGGDSNSDDSEEEG